MDSESSYFHFSFFTLLLQIVPLLILKNLSLTTLIKQQKLCTEMTKVLQTGFGFMNMNTSAVRLNILPGLSKIPSTVNNLTMSTHLFEAKDHVDLYTKFRPVPPPSLLSRLLCYAGHDSGFTNGVAVDLGCGSGQMTGLLAQVPGYSKVIGVDVSKAQIDQARANLPHSHVILRTGSAEEQPDIEHGSVDLVTICQALHWLDIPKFYKEVERIVKPGGTLAVIGYSFTTAGPGKDSTQLGQFMKELYSQTRPYWSWHRDLVDSGYHTIPPLPWPPSVRDDSHYTEMDATLQDWAGYIQTWSGYRAMAKEEPEKSAKLVEDFLRKCAGALGKPDIHPKHINMKLRTNYWLMMCQKTKL